MPNKCPTIYMHYIVEKTWAKFTEIFVFSRKMVSKLDGASKTLRYLWFVKVKFLSLTCRAQNPRIKVINKCLSLIKLFRWRQMPELFFKHVSISNSDSLRISSIILSRFAIIAGSKFFFKKYHFWSHINGYFQWWASFSDTFD